MLVILSYPTLCDPMDFGPPGSPIHGILQARILEWVAIPFSRRSFQFRDQTQVSRIIGRFFTIWAAQEAKQKPCLLSNKNIRAVKVKVSQSCLPLQSHGLHSLWNFPSQNTGVGSCYLFQGIFPTQGSNPDLPNCRWILYELSYKGSPRILECVAYPFSRGTSWPRNWTRVSCIAGRFLRAFLVAQLVKSPPAMQETWVWSPGEGKGLPTPVFWPGDFHRMYSLWGHKESDMTEKLSL